MKAKRKRRTTASPGGSRRAAGSAGCYVLKLFIAGATVRSRQAVLRVHELCQGELNGICTMEVIDIYQQPRLARIHQIVATPTLIQELPKPIRRFIGSLANLSGLVAGECAVVKSEIAG